MRRFIFIFTVIVLAACLAACGKAGPSGPTGEVIDAWKKAGLDASGFGSSDSKGIGGGTCSSGKVSGIETTICEFGDADAAKKAEAAGLTQVGDATGAAIAQGKLLLVVADRTKADPTGKTIKQLAAAFRNR